MATFAEDLATWGPQRGAETPVTGVEARTYCRRLATTHYENFPVVSWLLPRHLRQHFYNVYSYCRWSDDLGDEIEEDERSLELLDWWLGELRACYAGSATHPVFVALSETIREFDIPAQPFEDLLSAFRQDRRVSEYETFDDLRNYCRRSADPVGRLVLYLCRSYNEQNVAWSDSICTGLQLANFWQDVARDLDIGRIYLPIEDCTRFGYAREDLRRRVTNDAFLKLMEFEVERARQLLCAGLPLVAALPGRLQIDIELFVRGGLKILEHVERIDYRVWETRPVVKKWDFFSLFVACVWNSLRRRLAPETASGQNHTK